ncbi:Cytochrome P450 [Melia azedarach]|uniref:Cytochrome P450 n=1 Tax=Melia azedarach TaxID=155640 RepID=A0ACC1YPE9_MELAZ|nr:Cytochrome P450 [Melia azedarach]
MDLVFLSLILLAFVVFFFILKRSKDRNLNLPPGPPRLPIIGNLHQMATGDPLPHRALRDLANQYGPLMYLQLGEVTTIVVSSPEYAKEVTTTHDLIFASRPHVPAAKILSYNYTDIAFAPYGPYWRQLRKICVMELLSPKRVQSFRPVREDEVSNLINWIASKAGSEINLTEKIFILMCTITSRAAFGNKTKDIELFQVVIAEATKMFAGSNIADMFPSITFLQSVTGLKAKIERMHQKTDRILTNIIDEHKVRRASGKSQKVEDLVDVLLNLQESGNLESPMTGENVKAVIMDVFSAGTETSATTVDWTMSELMRNPKVMKKAQAEVREVFNRRGKVDEAGLEEMQYLKLIIKETLRLRPSAPMLFPRECAETCNINGYDIPAKANVLVNVWAMTRDPKYWTEPDSYIPERFLDSSIDFKGTNYEYIPFGSGRRMCPGMTYASANIELPLAMLLYHFDWILPNGMKPEEMDMTEGFGVTVRRKQDLCLIPIPYQPSPVE